jgi:putative inorganic carbon (HCO3(-)) transporter
MMALKANLSIYFWGLLYVLLSGYFIWQDLAYLQLFSVGLLAIYAAIFHTNTAFLGLALFAPMSVNIEEWTQTIGLFVPTEPLLFGFLILLLMMETRRSIVPKYIWQNPIVITAGIYCVWLFLTSITSTHPLASFKFLLVRIWYFAPLLLLGPIVFKDLKNIKKFLYLLVGGMIVGVVYTLLHHAQYSFGEKEGHWVMSPLFKDHTIYGATVALIFVLLLGMYLSKKHPPLTTAMLLAAIGIIGLGLYFSYTRAAWLSVIAAFGVGLLIKFKIKFTWLLGITAILGVLLFATWDQIQMEMARNTQEHTTENFSEKIQSATNVTTDASNLERLNRWSCAWEMFKQRPVMGFGPGTYAFEYASFQHPDNLTIISTNFGNGGNAHSEYLGPLSETGLPGLIIVLTLVGFLFYRGIMLYINIDPAETEWRTIVLFSIMALTTYFVHGFLNNYLDTDKAAVPVWGIAAIFIALEQGLKSEKIKKKETI